MGCPRQGRSRGLSVPAITSYPSDLTAALAGWIRSNGRRLNPADLSSICALIGSDTPEIVIPAVEIWF